MKKFSFFTLILLFLLTFNLSYSARSGGREIVGREQIQQRRRTTNVPEETFKKWKQALEFGVTQHRIKVINAIIAYNDPKTFKLLEKILKDDASLKVKKEAVRAVFRLKYKKALPLVAKQLDEEDHGLREATLHTLGRMGYKKASAKILPLLDSDNVAVKSAAIRAAGLLKLKKTLAKLHKIAESIEQKDIVKEAAIIAIGKIGDKSSIKVLEKIFNNPAFSKYVRMYCVTSLGMIGGKKVIKHLKKAFRSRQYFIKLRAVEALGRVNLPEVYPLLKAALSDDHWKIRVQAVRAIVKQKQNKKYLAQLKYMILNEAKYEVKKEAVITFIQIGGSEAFSFIDEQLKIPGNSFLKYYIVLGLKRIKQSKSLPILVKMYKKNKNNNDVRNSIIKTLRDFNTPESIKKLKELLFFDHDTMTSFKNNQEILKSLTIADPSEVLDAFKKIIYKSFKYINDISDPVKKRAETLKKEKYLWLKVFAVRLLKAIKNKKGHDLIKKLVDDNEVNRRVRVAAIDAAGEAKIKSLIPKLKKMFLASIDSYETYVLRRALIRLKLNGATLDEEKKKADAERQRTGRRTGVQRQIQQMERTRRTQTRQTPQTGQSQSTQNRQTRQTGQGQSTQNRQTGQTRQGQSNQNRPTGQTR